MNGNRLNWMVVMFVLFALLASLTPVALAQGGQEYTVQQGDNLWKLAETNLGDGLLYRALVAANNAKEGMDKIDPIMPLKAGMKIYIPTKDEATQLMATLPTPVPPTKVILATTTSTADSGLLTKILPDFERRYNAKVDVIAVGSGQAMKLGQDGNADVLLVHSPAAEQQFMAEGSGWNRQDVMYNDYVIIGPASDPAGIKGMTNATEAFKKIADSKAKFISRGDNSGTNAKEMSIWKAAGIEKPAGDWYVSTGQGMGEVLNMANEQQAYTLSDRGTYLSRKNLELPVLVEGDKTLFNPYGVIAVNPIKYPTVKYDMATKFIDWITSVDGQKLIGNFKDATSGKPLFTPDSLTWKASQGKPARNLTILHAGSLANVLKDLTAAYKAKNPDATFILERGGSVDTARKISDYGRLADIMMSADYDVIDKYVIPQWASWNLKHATNSMVLAYTDQSKFGNEINANNWFDVLAREGVKYGHTDPAKDPGGYRALMVWQLAEKFYNKPGLYKQLSEAPADKNMVVDATYLDMLKSGKLDYTFTYRSQAMQNVLKYVELPAEVNLADPTKADLYATAKVEIPGAKSGEKVTISGLPIL
jgi:tungstate transport system substrate-binding protein